MSYENDEDDIPILPENLYTHSGSKAPKMPIVEGIDFISCHNIIPLNGELELKEDVLLKDRDVDVDSLLIIYEEYCCCSNKPSSKEHLELVTSELLTSRHHEDDDNVVVGINRTRGEGLPYTIG